jgi:hypothetical protein
MKKRWTMQARSDRTVYARAHRFEIVRYARAGQWWIEYEPQMLVPASHVGVHTAAYEAACLLREGTGTVFMGLPGGRVFDRSVQRQVGELAEGRPLG